MTNPTDDIDVVLRVAKLIHEDAFMQDGKVGIGPTELPYGNNEFNPNSPDTCVALMERYGEHIETSKIDDEFACRYYIEGVGDYEYIEQMKGCPLSSCEIGRAMVEPEVYDKIMHDFISIYIT